MRKNNKVASSRAIRNNNNPLPIIDQTTSGINSIGSNIDQFFTQNEPLPENRTKMEAIKEELNDLAANSSFYGIAKVSIARHPFLKITWLFMSLAMLAAGIYLSFRAIDDYLSFNAVTNIEKSSVIPMKFPAVTICGFGINFASINGTFKPSFRGRDLTHNDFESFKDSYYGDCLRFNGYPNDTTQIKTVDGANDLNLLALQIPIMLIDPDSDREYAIVYITPNRLNSFENSTGYNIRRGSSYVIYLKKSVDEKLKEPFNRCLNESLDYFSENCMEQCFQKESATKYACSLLGYYQNKNLAVCGGHKRLREQIKEYCQGECVAGCSKSSYEVVFLRDDGAVAIGAALKVSFSSLDVTRTSQSPLMSFWDLIGNMGGTLGLFIGFQFLTLLEIFDFLFTVLKILIR